MARFDGENSWEIIDIPFEEEFLLFGEMAELYTIHIDDENVKWLGTNSGLLRYDDEEWTIFNDNTIGTTNFSFRDVWDIAQTDNGDLFIASFEVYKYDGENFTNLSEGEDDLFSYGGASIESHGNQVWFCNAFFIMAQYNEGEWQNVYRAQGDENGLPAGFMIDIKIDNSGVPYILYNTQNTRLVKLVEDTWVELEDEQISAIQYPTKRLFFDETGNRWLTERSKVSRISDSEYEQTQLNNSPLVQNYASFIKQSPNGSIYCYSAWGFEQKLVKFTNPTNWIDVDLPDLETAIYDIEFNSQGEMFLVTGNLIYQLVNDEWLVIPFPIENVVGLPSMRMIVYSVLMAKIGNYSII